MRHKWVRIVEHKYICSKCGTGKVNENRDGAWVTVYHCPNGFSVVSRITPPCERGQYTDRYLGKYEDAIATGGCPKPKKPKPGEVAVDV